jgi:hypothetical protein
MGSKLISALVATALVAAVPSVAAAEEGSGGSDRATIVGVLFGSAVVALLILIRSHDHNIPVSP